MGTYISNGSAGHYVGNESGLSAHERPWRQNHQFRLRVRYRRLSRSRGVQQQQGGDPRTLADCGARVGTIRNQRQRHYTDDTYRCDGDVRACRPGWDEGDLAADPDASFRRSAEGRGTGRRLSSQRGIGLPHRHEYHARRRSLHVSLTAEPTRRARMQFHHMCIVTTQIDEQIHLWRDVMGFELKVKLTIPDGDDYGPTIFAPRVLMQDTFKDKNARATVALMMSKEGAMIELLQHECPDVERP